MTAKESRLKKLSAKEYLMQLKKIDTVINNKLIELTRWKDVALSITPNIGGERVQSSSNQQRMACAIEKYVDIDKEINNRIDELYNTKQEILDVIEQLPEVEYDVLHKIYVQDKTLYEVSSERGIAYSSVTAIHARALKLVDDILSRT